VKILSPFDNLSETAALIEAGADELYGGVEPPNWKAGIVSSSQRTFDSAHFSSEDEFASAVKLASSVGARVSITLNAPMYEKRMQPALVALAKRAEEWGVKGVVVADPSLILALKDGGVALELTLSTMAGALNAADFAFYNALGIARAVLPRHLTISEVKKIVDASPGITFESFILVGKCPNEEAHCSFQHTSADKRWPCEIDYNVKNYNNQLFEGHPFIDYLNSWRGCDRRFACGLCAIHPLIDAGVGVLKLVGRGGPSAGKVENVRLVKRFLEDRELTQADALSAYNERFGRSCSPLICYYPEFHPSRR